MSNWEDTFQFWSQPPSATEQDKCANAEGGIKKAVEASSLIAGKAISTFAQGSYPSNTNVRLDSDVDVCVLCRDTFFFDLPPGKLKENYSITPATLTFGDYKNLLHTTLVNQFGAKGVTRGDKAFDVHSNTYRVDADAIPAFEYRYYYDPYSAQFISGVAFLCDKDNRRIYNYPVQSLANGRAKNERTSRRYKRVVRILKALRNEMQDNRIDAASDVPSFLIESLVYQVPDARFGQYVISGDVKDTLSFLLVNLVTDESCAAWTEVNEIKSFPS